MLRGYHAPISPDPCTACRGSGREIRSVLEPHQRKSASAVLGHADGVAWIYALCRLCRGLGGRGRVAGALERWARASGLWLPSASSTEIRGLRLRGAQKLEANACAGEILVQATRSTRLSRRI